MSASTYKKFLHVLYICRYKYPDLRELIFSESHRSKWADKMEREDYKNRIRQSERERIQKTMIEPMSREIEQLRKEKE
jgi:hypothetical protein